MTRMWDELANGTTLVLVGEPWSAEESLRLIRDEGITMATGVPTQWSLVLAHPDVERTDFSGLRVGALGGASIAPDLVRQIRKVLGCPVITRYTSTEAGVCTSTLVDDDAEVVATTVGRPAPEVELRIVDPDDGSEQPTGEVGEVRCRSAAMMRGYWRDPERTTEAIDADGWLHTGDLGFVGADGNLRIVGRLKEMYIRGGYNVYPAEVEAVLAEHPSVVRAAVVGAPDPVLGEVGVAFVVPAPGLAAADPRRRCGRGAATAWRTTRHPIASRWSTSCRSLRCSRSTSARCVARDNGGEMTTEATIQPVGSGDTSEKPIKLGGALFTMVEPHPGHEVAYNRWYERDHFYAGCMIGAWTVSGARYVATTRVQGEAVPVRLTDHAGPDGRLVPRALLDPRREVRRVDEVGHRAGELAPRQRPDVHRARPHPHAHVQVPRRAARRCGRRARRARARPPLPGPGDARGGAARGQGRPVAARLDDGALAAARRPDRRFTPVPLLADAPKDVPLDRRRPSAWRCSPSTSRIRSTTGTATFAFADELDRRRGGRVIFAAAVHQDDRRHRHLHRPALVSTDSGPSRTRSSRTPGSPSPTSGRSSPGTAPRSRSSRPASRPPSCSPTSTSCSAADSSASR